MKLINVEPKDNYVLRVYLDDDSIIDFDVKPELERIPCYKPLYNKELFNTVKFKNKRIYWSEQFDFHLDQILESGFFIKDEVKANELREYELKIAMQEAQADLAAGQYVIETADEHINRMIKEHGIQTENA